MSKLQKITNKHVQKSDIESRLSGLFDTSCKLFVRFYHRKDRDWCFQMTKIYFHYRGDLHIAYQISDLSGLVKRIKMNHKMFEKTEKILLNNLKFELKDTSVYNRQMLNGTKFSDRQLTYIKSIEFENIVDEIYNIFRLYDTYLLEDKKIINTIDDVNL